MNVDELLAELSQRGVQLWTDGDQLRCRAPKAVLTPELCSSLIECKAELLLLLHQRNVAVSATCSSLVAIQPRGSKLPFFCVHGLGGGALYYSTLARYLSPEQPFYGLQSQGMDGKLPPHIRIEDIAAHNIKEVLTVQSEGPYFLGGHSFGCIVVFEMAHQLVAQGQKVALLALLDGLSPNLFAKEFNLLNGRLLPEETLKDYERIVVAANTEAAINYVPQAYPGQVILFQAIVKLSRTYYESQLGWGELAARGVELQEIPGNHKDMIFSESHARILAEKLQASLDKAQADN